MTLRQRLEQLLTEIDYSVKYHNAHWEEDRAKGMLDVAHDIKYILEYQWDGEPNAENPTEQTV